MNIKYLRKLISEALINAYKILGVSQNATPEEIKLAFRKKAMETHPDKHPGDPSALENSQQVSLAYGLLSNPVKRSKLDNELRYYAGQTTPGASSAGSRRGPEQEYYDWSTADRARQAQVKKEREERNTARAGWKERARRAAAERQARAQQAAQAEHQARKEREAQSYARQPKNAQNSPWRYYINTTNGSRKFWGWSVQEISDSKVLILIKYGRIGATGTTKTHTFFSIQKANSFISKLAYKKRIKGYRLYDRDPSDGTTASSYTQSQAKSAYEKAKQDEPKPSSDDTSDATKTYKVYPRPTHLRYKTKKYVADTNTKFTPDQRVNVSQKDADNVSVKDPNSDHTQTWKHESVKSIINHIIAEHIVRLMNK